MVVLVYELRRELRSVRCANARFGFPNGLAASVQRSFLHWPRVPASIPPPDSKSWVAPEGQFLQTAKRGPDLCVRSSVCG